MNFEGTGYYDDNNENILMDVDDNNKEDIKNKSSVTNLSNIYQTIIFTNTCPECGGTNLKKVYDLNGKYVLISCKTIPKIVEKTLKATNIAKKNTKPGNIKTELTLKPYLSEMISQKQCPYWSFQKFTDCTECGPFDKPPRKSKQIAISSTRVVSSFTPKIIISSPSILLKEEDDMLSNDSSFGGSTPNANHIPRVLKHEIFSGNSDVPEIKELYTRPIKKDIGKKVFFCARPIKNPELVQKYEQIMKIDFPEKLFQIDPEITMKYKESLQIIEKTPVCGFNIKINLDQKM